MWYTLNIHGYTVNIKYYSDSSCIGKLSIAKNGKMYARYDRGWDKFPSSIGALVVLLKVWREFKMQAKEA